MARDPAIAHPATRWGGDFSTGYRGYEARKMAPVSGLERISAFEAGACMETPAGFRRTANDVCSDE